MTKNNSSDACIACGLPTLEDHAIYCPDCYKKFVKYDQKTVRDLMEELDAELQKYLSDNLRNQVWNVLAERFLVEED